MQQTLRPAEAGDIPALAALHADSWRKAYAALLPAAAFGAPMAAYMAQKWAGGGQCLDDVRVTFSGSELVGFAAIDPDRNGGCFLDNLHVASTSQGRGIGRTLMLWAAGRAEARPLWLTVLAGNADARAMYRKWTGEEGPVFETRLLGLTVPALRIAWASGDDLIQHLRARA